MTLNHVSDKTDCAVIEKIYTQSFPDNERAPFKMLIKRAARGKADFWAVCDGETIIGMAYVVCHSDLAYLFYIAIAPTSRGKGFGTKTIRSLMEKYRGKRFFLALEQLDNTADNYTQRVKRHDFYTSCGLFDLPFKLKEGTVTFSAMGARPDDGGELHGDFTVLPEEYSALMHGYMGFFMRLMVDVRLIP